MKKWQGIVILIFLTLTLSAQQFSNEKVFGRFLNKSGVDKSYIWKICARSAALFTAGLFDGTAEILRSDYPAFKKRFPNAKDEFWDMRISHRNKWKNGDYTQGPAYFGSTTFLAWTTDGYHLVRTLRNFGYATALIIPIGGKKKWYVYIIELAVNYMAWTGGFNLTYHWYFKHNY